MNFDNGAYQPNEFDDVSMFEQAVLTAGEQLKEMEQQEMAKNLDITKLDVKRRSDNCRDAIFKSHGGHGGSRIKLASLDCDDEMDDEEDVEIHSEMDAAEGSKALLRYFCTLGKPCNTSDIDVKFVDMLCTFGDINVRDKHGQSLMHEVAREWSTDIANFMVIKGIDINAVDQWGRTPLFVAVAANYKEMVRWLVDHKASIHQQTKKPEGQYPIHYAAKYDAVEVFELLMELGADPVQRDLAGRTPFYVAAENGNGKICKCFLDWELPTVSYTHQGDSTIDQIINNLSTELTLRALNQFIVESRNTMSPTVKVYLSCLGKRRWRLLNMKREKPHGLINPMPPTPLEIIIKRQELTVIKHPAILELIKLKAKRYGYKWNNFNIMLNVIFTLLWISCASIRVNEFEDPGHVVADVTAWNAVFVLAIVAQVLTIGFMYKLYREWRELRVLANAEKVRMQEDYKKNVGSCHPRWVDDHELLAKKLEAVKSTPSQFWLADGIYTEVFCLGMCCVYFVITLIWYAFESTKRYNSLQDVRMIFSIILIFAVFLRLNRCFQSFQSIGPFITMIGECVVCFGQIFFLFFEFFVPFSVAFWVFFGGPVLQQSGEYKTFQNLLYQLWLLSFVGDYDYDSLKEASHLVSQIIISLYFVLVSIITINIYVALLSESFARVNATALAKAYMALAQFIQNVELLMPDYKRELEVYMTKYCSPMNLRKEEFEYEYKSNEENPRGILKDIVREIFAVGDATRTIQENDMALRNDIHELQEKVQDVKTKFGEEKVGAYVKELSTLFKERRMPLTKAATKANTGIISIRNRIVDMM